MKKDVAMPIASKFKLRLFKITAFLLPFLLFVLVEVLLRIFNYGHNTSLFIKYPDDTSKWVMNRYSSERFFSDTVNATRGGIEPFNIHKKPGTLRIFVLGESTTAGYPYFHNGSFHRWLLYRLMHTFPDKNFEVINLALTAVNSYTVLDFSRKVIDFQPDAVLVYVGHNEYYGALGVGSTSRIAGNYYLVQAVLKLREFRLVQLIENLIYKFKTTVKRQNIDDRENLMKRMAAKQRIPYGGEDYKKGIKQFELNMDKMCRLFESKHIPVFLSTLVSNEKDLKPLSSAAKNSSQSANENFRKAASAYNARNFTLAKKEYIKAKEFDLLRFRAPEAMNQIIKKLVVNYPNIHLVDASYLFEQYSSYGILGKETLIDHVHPNLYGYALLSEAFYQSIKKFKVISPDTSNEMKFIQLLRQMPVTKIDSLYGAYQIMMLKTGWPFNEPINANFKRGNSIEERLAGPLSVNGISWLQATNELFKHSMKTNDKKTALKAAEAVLLESPNNNLYYLYCGRLNFELGNQAEAEFYFKKAFQLDSSSANAQNLYLLFIKNDQPEKALSYLNLAIEKSASSAGLENYRQVTIDLVKLKKLLLMQPSNTAVRLKISVDYQRLNESELANKYIRFY